MPTGIKCSLVLHDSHSMVDVLQYGYSDLSFEYDSTKHLVFSVAEKHLMR